jgi:hypothetical protein
MGPWLPRIIAKLAESVADYASDRLFEGRGELPEGPSRRRDARMSIRRHRTVLHLLVALAIATAECAWVVFGAP